MKLVGCTTREGRCGDKENNIPDIPQESSQLDPGIDLNPVPDSV